MLFHSLTTIGDDNLTGSKNSLHFLLCVVIYTSAERVAGLARGLVVVVVAREQSCRPPDRYGVFHGGLVPVSLPVTRKVPSVLRRRTALPPNRYTDRKPP